MSSIPQEKSPRFTKHFRSQNKAYAEIRYNCVLQYSGLKEGEKDTSFISLCFLDVPLENKWPDNTESPIAPFVIEMEYKDYDVDNPKRVVSQWGSVYLTVAEMKALIHAGKQILADYDLYYGELDND